MTERERHPFGTPWAIAGGMSDAEHALAATRAHHVELKTYVGVTGFDRDAVRATPISAIGVQGVQKGASPHIDGFRHVMRQQRRGEQ